MKIPNTSRLAKTTLLSILSLAGLIFLAPTVLQSASADGGSSTTPTFSNYELAGNPFTTGASVGTTCPNTLRTCMNTEGEPSMRPAPDGSFYGSSEHDFCVIGGQCGGTFAYKSTDGGQHFTTLPLPNSASSGRIGFSPAGGDTDIAVAPSRNLNGFFNVYVASLATSPPLANVYVSTSRDGGGSWVLNPTGASIPVDDREWIAADGADKVCVSYHAISATNDIFVTCSLNGGTSFTQTGNAFDPAHVAFLAGFNNVIGNMAIDPNNHVVYQVFSSVASAAELAQCTIFCHVHTVWIAVSTDGGLTFTDTIVYNNPNTNLDYGHQFINVSVDTAGNVYAVYSDNHNIFYSFSTTLGQTWSGPFHINKGQSKTAIFPWSSAGSNGALDVVWYGTNFFDGVNPPDSYPMTAAWKVYFSQNLKATTPGSSWSQVDASGIIHYGGVCESGVTCTGNRDLLDDFGVAASPTTGLAAIIYTSDQFVNSTAEPATRRSSTSPFCTRNTTNDIDCEHTNIAVQTGGAGVIIKTAASVLAAASSTLSGPVLAGRDSLAATVTPSLADMTTRTSATREINPLGTRIQL